MNLQTLNSKQKQFYYNKEVTNTMIFSKNFRIMNYIISNNQKLIMKQKNERILYFRSYLIKIILRKINIKKKEINTT